MPQLCPSSLAALWTRVLAYRRSGLFGLLLLVLLLATAVTLLLLLIAVLLKLPVGFFPTPPPRSPHRSHPRLYRIYPAAFKSAATPSTSCTTPSNSTNHSSNASSCFLPDSHGSPAMHPPPTASPNQDQADQAADSASQHPQQQELVPGDLWQTFRSAPLPRPAQETVDSWSRLNPRLRLHLHTDGDAERFVASAGLGAEALAAYRSFPLGVMRADFWRYAVLQREGGVYADVDARCRQPVREWLPPRDGGAAHLPLEHLYSSLSWSNCSAVIGLENDVHWCQWAFAATAGHPLLAAVLDTIVHRARGGIDTSDEHFVHKHTGPGTWTAAIRTFFNFSAAASARDMFNAVYSDPAWYGAVVGRHHVCFVGADFFNTLNVENLYGSQTFGHEEEGWVSWTKERDRLIGRALVSGSSSSRL